VLVPECGGLGPAAAPGLAGCRAMSIPSLQLHNDAAHMPSCMLHTAVAAGKLWLGSMINISRLGSGMLPLTHSVTFVDASIQYPSKLPFTFAIVTRSTRSELQLP
jgi:hypothetical protein